MYRWGSAPKPEHSSFISSNKPGIAGILVRNCLITDNIADKDVRDPGENKNVARHRVRTKTKTE